jgi:hypothetical protein
VTAKRHRRFVITTLTRSAKRRFRGRLISCEVPAAHATPSLGEIVLGPKFVRRLLFLRFLLHKEKTAPQMV